MAEKNVTMLVAAVEPSSQELCDLYRKATNLDVKTVSEGGHNNQVHSGLLSCTVSETTQICTLIKAM